jgi:hypothetical protein
MGEKRALAMTDGIVEKPVVLQSLDDAEGTEGVAGHSNLRDRPLFIAIVY